MDRRHRWLKHAPVAGGVVLVLMLVIGLVWVIRGFMATKDQKPERRVQNITVIRPPPPPPEETPPPPPPEKVEQQIPQNEPEPTPDNVRAPSQQLGLDAAGGAGDDAFGLAARQGGSDLVGTGGAPFAWYQRKVAADVTECLSIDAKLQAKKYAVPGRLWVDQDRHVRNVELTGTTGNHELDIQIAQDLKGCSVEPPSLEMPQPINLKIVSRS